ncbi:MAG: hypothetical protein H8D47_02330 [Planctomycetes bacterium]|nr:hypothetical protein [Planctomycetota bacterium]MBL7106076.1 hypothetical protein [Phycisphaerae bacterium]
MKLNFLSLSILLINTAAYEAFAASDSVLPPIETCIISPAEVENVSIWVPAVKSGPFINRSCKPKRNLVQTSQLPVSIVHKKNNRCLDEVARMLAEQVHLYNECSLPLTIFNGWQWQSISDNSHYQQIYYCLAARGGCWENCSEAILNACYSRNELLWLRIDTEGNFNVQPSDHASSNIELKTFSNVRTRNGYPKIRKL